MIPDGFEIRPPTSEDIEDMTEMLVSTDLADTGTSESDADLIRDQWSSHGFHPSEDACVITDPNRAIVAYRSVTPDGEGKMKSWGIVHHDHRGRGLGATLLDRMEARASERLRGTAAAKLHTAVNEADASAAELVRSRGFGLVRTFRHLKIDLAGPAPDPVESPVGIAIRGIEPERDLRRLHAIFVEAFSAEWGYRPISFEEWVGNEVETQLRPQPVAARYRGGRGGRRSDGRGVGRPGLGGRARRSRTVARPRDRVGLAATGVRHVRVPRAATGDAER